MHAITSGRVARSARQNGVCTLCTSRQTWRTSHRSYDGNTDTVPSVLADRQTEGRLQ